VLSQSLGTKRSTLFDDLTKLLQIRNHLSHDLDGFRKSAQILEQKQPVVLLKRVLSEIEPICTLPLFRAENLPPKKKIFSARIFMLMGEQGNPIPQEYEITEPFEDNQVYLGLPDGVLSLHPTIVWNYQGHISQGLHLIHRVKDPLEYTGVSDSPPPGRLPQFSEMQRLLDGERISVESVGLATGLSFQREWEKQREELLPVKPFLPESVSLSNHWNEMTCLEQMTWKCGHFVAETVCSLWRWLAESKAANVIWGRQQNDGVFGLGEVGYDDWDDMSECWLVVWASGRVDIQVRKLEYGRSDFNADSQSRLEDFRRQLVEKIKAIPDIALSEEHWYFTYSFGPSWEGNATIDLIKANSESILIEVSKTLLWYSEAYQQLYQACFSYTDNDLDFV
jgi:hypothetical protein